MKSRSASVLTVGFILAAGMIAQGSAQQGDPGQVPVLGYTREEPQPEPPAIEPIDSGEPAVLDIPLQQETRPAAVDDLRAAYDAIRSDIVIVYEDGQKIAWEGQLACVLRQTGWKPWSSGERSVSDAADLCERVQGAGSAEPEETSNEVRVGMDNGKITVVENLGSGEGWFLERRMSCGMDGLPISTMVKGEAKNGNKTVTIQTGRAYSQGAAVAAEQACIEAARAAM